MTPVASPQQCHQAALTAKVMLTRAPEGGEGQQVGEMLFGEGDQILHQHPLRGGEQFAFQQRPPIFQKLVPAKRDHLLLLDLYAAQSQQLGLVTGRMADNFALDHDNKLVAETQHSVQALLADPLLDLRRGQVEPFVR